MTRGLSILLISVALGTSTPPAPSFRIVDLGTLGGRNSYGLNLNDLGMVIGSSDLPDVPGNPPAWAGFLWTAMEGMRNLGRNTHQPHDINNRGVIVGGPRAYVWRTSTGAIELPLNGWAVGINEAGLVGGNARVKVCDSRPVCIDRVHAFSWTADGGVVMIGAFDPYDFSFFRGVNERGQIVGSTFSETVPGTGRAFLWSATDGLRDITHQLTSASAISNREQVVGAVGYRLLGGGWQTHAMSWTETGGLLDLGALPGSFDSYATAVNDGGQVVGNSENTLNHAFMWTPSDGMIDLGTLGGCCSQAAAINASGQVVGTASYGTSRAKGYVWTKETGMIDLGTLGGISSEAVAINARGQVTGSSYLPDGRQHAVLWHPISPRMIAANLIALVSGAGFHQGVSVLRNATESVDRGNIPAACNQTDAFLNQIRAQSGKSISGEESTLWMLAAGDLLSALECR
jgi:probable HAF family extracellular repeat protein